MKTRQRIALAWRQMLDGLRGEDHRARADLVARGIASQDLELQRLRVKANSRPAKVMQIEHVDLGSLGRHPDGDQFLRGAIRCRFFSVPSAFMLEEDGYLQSDYAIDKFLMSRDPSMSSFALEQVIKNAAAKLGEAIVCGVPK